LGAEYQWDSWRDLLYTIQTGKPALAKQYGTGATIWTYLNTHPQDRQAFQRGLTANARLIIPSLLASYDFSGVKRLVDLGGGHGELAVSLLHRYPHLTAILFDRASIIAEAQEGMQHLPEDIRARFLLESGSFFEAVPPGADCYVVKNVLMDWSDAEYLQILRGCRLALDRNAGHLLVVEPVISEAASFTKFFSLQMSMMMNAAHHRSVEEHRVLFEQAGFHLTQVIPLGLEQVLLEGTPFARASKEVAP
jgi:O-methyltransferase domain